MPADDLRGMSNEDLASELYETRRELMNLRFQGGDYAACRHQRDKKGQEARLADSNGDARA